jgi:hypothetical protein
MTITRNICCGLTCTSAAMLLLALGSLAGSDKELPEFGRDTVLVWKTVNQDYSATLVVRIAEFSPNRFLEWEDANTQGTIFMPSSDIEGAKGYVSSELFKSGIDARGKNVTTLWLSRRIFHDLKEKKRAKFELDGVATLLSYLGDDHLTVDVNRTTLELPVIKIADDRGSERWFLDDEANPLMLKHSLRQYTQTLTSITTDKHNTLRWIKGSKLANLPQ